MNSNSCILIPIPNLNSKFQYSYIPIFEEPKIENYHRYSWTQTQKILIWYKFSSLKKSVEAKVSHTSRKEEKILPFYHIFVYTKPARTKK